MSEEIPTRKRLTLALAKLKRDAAQAGKAGPSISAVAREAGVSHTLIHTKYPDIADQIRDASGRGPKQQLEKQRTLVKRVEDRAAELRGEVAALRKQNQGLASENGRLILLVRSLEQKVFAMESGATLLRTKARKN